MENNPAQSAPVTPDEQKVSTSVQAPPPIDPEPSPTPPPQPAKKSGMNRLLLVTIIIILIGFGLLGGYLLGIKQNTAPIENTMITPSPTKMPPTATPTISSSAATLQNAKLVKAGLASSTVFKPYNIQVLDGWTDADENTQSAGVDKLTITNNNYSITISQGAFGGGGCIYKGDPPSQMTQSFTDFAEINSTINTYRRSWNQDTAKTISYAVCQKATDGSYGSITTFGRIDVVSPNPADPTILSQIDSMIASMVQQ